MRPSFTGDAEDVVEIERVLVDCSLISMSRRGMAVVVAMWVVINYEAFHLMAMCSGSQVRRQPVGGGLIWV